MFRIKIALIIFGGVLVFWGYQEFAVSRGTSEEPVPAELADLEAGEPLPNNHVEIGEHLCVYNELIYEYSESQFASGEPDPDTSVTWAYYPIVSPSHPFTAKLAKQIARIESGEGSAAQAMLSPPKPNSFTVLVKTDRFETVGDLAGGYESAGSVEGMVVNRISSLGADERELLSESFPNADLDQVLILEEAREPSSLLASLGMMGGGGLLALLGIGLFFIGGGTTD